MASTGATFPGTAASSSTGVAWSSPDGIKSDGDSTFRSSSGLSQQLRATNFGFSVPSTATILGILLQIKRRHTVDVNTVDSSVRILKAGTATGDDKANEPAAEWPQTDVVGDYGGASDLWGTTWTPSDINNSGFGAYLINNVPSASGDSYVDWMKINVYFSTPGGSLFFAQY